MIISADVGLGNTNILHFNVLDRHIILIYTDKRAEATMKCGFVVSFYKSKEK